MCCAGSPQSPRNARPGDEQVVPDASIVPLGATTSAYLQLPGGWFRNNAGWIAGQDRTLLVDTCATQARTEHLLDTLRQQTQLRPLTAVITHAHGDHSHGAGHVARQGATILASPTAADEIATGPRLYPDVFHYDDWGDITPPDTIQTVVAPLHLDLGDQEVDVLPVTGRAHTAGDLVVWAPRDGVLFTGDLLFNQVTPLALSGSVVGWLATLDWLEQFDARHVVAGHGPLLEPRGAIDAVRSYLRWTLDAVDGDDDPDFDALQQQGAELWPDWPDSERHAANLRVAHADLHNTICEQATALAAIVTVAEGPIPLEL